MQEGGQARALPDASPAPAPDLDDPFAHIPDADRETPLPASRGQKKKIVPGSTASPRKKPANLRGMTRKRLREDLFHCFPFEHHNSYSGITKDGFGFVDEVAVKPGLVRFVQTCVRSRVADHIGKMAKGKYKIGNGQEERCFFVAKDMIENPGTELCLYVWDQPGGPGTTWLLEVRPVTVADLQASIDRARKRGVA